MKSVVKFALAMAAATAALVSVARADTLSFYYSFDGTTYNPAGGTVTLNPITGTTTWSQAIVNGSNDFSISVTASPSSILTLPSVFDTNAITITSTGVGNLFLAIVDQGISLPTGTNPFTAAYSASSLTNATVFGSSYLDPANGSGVPSAGSEIGTTQQFSTSITPSTSGSFTTGPGPYSVTDIYDAQLGAGANVNATVSVSVPGPIVGAGLPGLIAACGGLIAFARRRRRQLA